MPAIWYPHGIGPRSEDRTIKDGRKFEGRAPRFVPAAPAVVVEVDGKFVARKVRDLQRQPAAQIVDLSYRQAATEGSTLEKKAS